jgi:hypothetical protein
MSSGDELDKTTNHFLITLPDAGEFNPSEE